MAYTLAEAQDEVATLVQQYRTNLNAYRAPGYKEAHARQHLIDPLLIALGWDVHNAAHAAPHRCEVIHEASLDIEGARKAPDYAFRFGAETVFYVEAKKPGVAIKTAGDAAFQLRRYAWSAKLPLSVLTDFEELAVYDCRLRPADTDKASIARVNYYSYDQYPDLWREIWAIFSREAVYAGSFDQYAQASKGKRGTTPVDAEFLKEIEGWREVLARNLALRNAALSIDELNDAVQRTIDRIIFLRMAEDRGIEPYARLQTLAAQDDIYAGLLDLCRQADAKYNSGLFDFSAKGDRLTPKLSLDDKVLKPILTNLYFPHPYEFSVMPAEILGNVYEQFLGKVIRLTAAHQAKVEEKPEVKKAGGIRYTPDYIVDNLVRQTIGPWIAAHVKPTDRLPLPPTFRVIDISCGSGSFALGAYQYLLDYHLQWYVDHLDLTGGTKASVTRRDAVLHLSGQGEWRLTVAEKKRILTAHIFGVDIDRQAVEVTKLSLLLKVLEGESGESLQLKLFDNERALPNLDANIKCGNSLIGSDYFTEQLLPDADEMKRVNPFDWAREFPQVFGPLPASPVRLLRKTRTGEENDASPVDDLFHQRGELEGGGFDVIVGNPPYIRIQVMKEWAPLEVEAYKQLYVSARTGNYDIYVVFVERALSLLNHDGRLGFILPHKFFNAQYGEPLRDLIAKGRYLSHVVHFGDQQVFAGVTTYTCLMFLDKAGRAACHFVKVTDLAAWRKTGAAIEGDIPADTITSNDWSFTVGNSVELFKRLDKMPTRLVDIASRIFQGFKTGADPVFILENRGGNLYYSSAIEAEIKLEPTYLRPLYKSGNMKRYTLHENSRSVIFPYRDGALIEWKEIVSRAPKMAQYLESCKQLLAKRENGRFIGLQWYCYSRNQALEIISSPKILTADLNPSANYCIDLVGDACFPGGAAGGYGIVVPQEMYLYLLGLLNSRAVDFYLKEISTNFRGGWYGYDAKVIRRLPIRAIDFTKAADKAAHDRMVKLVDTMLQLHPRLAVAQAAHDRDLIQRQIDATDRQIDALVYQLYGLTEEEIKIVEGR